MAILGIRTALGPQATAERQRLKAQKQKRKQELDLQKEQTKQTQAQSDESVAIFGLAQEQEEPPGFLSTPEGQLAVAVGAGATFIAWRRGMFG